MTPAERTALRIAQNRAITEKVEERKREDEREGRNTPVKTPRKSSAANASTARVLPQPPPTRSTTEFLRVTPEERAQLGSFIRKVQS